jgi:hypothetical protein
LQSFNVLECPEFRDLLLYLGDGKISNADVPHRTKLTQMVLEEYWREYNKIKEDLKVCGTAIINFVTHHDYFG